MKLNPNVWNDIEAKETIVIHILSIMQSLTQTRNKNLIDSLNFEDMVWRLMGSNSYLLFTFDRLVQITVKTLQGLLAENVNIMHFKLFKTYNQIPT